MMIPPGALAALLQNMPPEMARAARMPAIGGGGNAVMPPEGSLGGGGGIGADELAAQNMRRDRIKGAMMEARAGFDAGLEAAPKPTPVTGPQPPQSAPPGQVDGATVGNMTPGPFPQRVTPETAPMQGGAAFPMSRGFRGGFPRFGHAGY